VKGNKMLLNEIPMFSIPQELDEYVVNNNSKFCFYSPCKNEDCQFNHLTFNVGKSYIKHSIEYGIDYTLRSYITSLGIYIDKSTILRDEVTLKKLIQVVRFAKTRLNSQIVHNDILYILDKKVIPNLVFSMMFLNMLT
jgi:hypothetical protein